ncbi:MAG: aldehyde:ferredoxin oxidoreductase [Anaerolinea sp.]|nr:aldehyde:ferredoxin oxidoreductase [Anaerolinea sp.]
MPNGYNGKILHVNLTDEIISIETPPESFYRTYMGGSAFGLHYILNEVPKGIEPLSPENILTLMLSVTTGAPISGQSRINANAKSPMTGGIGDSQAGGFFPAELKFAGFDGIVIRGKSQKPVYLSILHGTAKLNDASHLWGKQTREVDQAVKAEIGDIKAQVMQIGPGAENGVRYSSIINMANRNNGRTGMGLVMASKNLKAIVVRGTEKVKVADLKTLSALAKTGANNMSTNPDMDGIGKLGTASVVVPQNALGTLPTRNYSEAFFEHAEALSGETMADTILKRRETCFSCVVRCKRVIEAEYNGITIDPYYGGPEYETLGTFGSMCGIQSLEAVSLANQICNAYGVDSITCGATIAFAIECYEKGIINSKDTGGIELKFGNTDAVLQVLGEIVNCSTPFGKVLAEGSARAAEAFGAESRKCLTTVKNEEAPMHMPQAKKSLALIYAVNPFGADHQSSEHDWMYEEGTSQLYLDRLALLGLNTPPPAGDFGPEKVRFAYLTQFFYSMLDTLELCQFVFGPAWTLFGPQETLDMVKAVTGWDVTLDELMKVGERRLNMLRAFNAREGFTTAEDVLPEKFFTPIVGKGVSAGVAVNRDDLSAALNQYYNAVGWTNNGNPTQNKLKELGLDWITL